MTGRDNGFVARHYVPLADLDPRLADAMLDVLRAENIAAYVEPSTGHVGGYLDVHLPERPRDRLWVDRERHDRAAILLTEHTSTTATTSASIPTPPSDERTPGDEPPIDDAWAQLIANYDTPPDDAVPRWPLAEDVPGVPWSMSDTVVEGQQTLPFDPANTGHDPLPAPVPRRIVRPADWEPARSTPASADPTATSGEYDPLSILVEHFVPPSPPPTPALRPITKWAIAAILTGFALILVNAFTDAIPNAVALGVVGIVGGFATLVAGMRQDRDDDSGSDDGAVV
jgi:hypothetical protein